MYTLSSLGNELELNPFELTMRRDFREENLGRPQDVLDVEGEVRVLAKFSRLLFAVCVVTAQWTGVAVIGHVAGMHGTEPVCVVEPQFHFQSRKHQKSTR